MGNDTVIIGLTGSIGMGKSTVAAQFASLGIEVLSADAIVHALLAKGGAAAEAVGRQFPEAAQNGAINRQALGNIVFGDREKLKLLESILHPLVVAEENRFIERKRGEKAKYAVLEIPLLYETGAEKRCDAVVVVTAPSFLQKYRVLKRPGMTKERLACILSQQMPDGEKRARADFIVQTGLGKAYSLLQVKRILKVLDARDHS